MTAVVSVLGFPFMVFVWIQIRIRDISSVFSSISVCAHGILQLTLLQQMLSRMTRRVRCCLL